MNQEELYFLKLLNLDSEIFLGGILKTNLFGIPLDFKYVNPVKPTKLQRILYGKSLEYFVDFELIAKNLLSEISSDFFVFVDNLILFDVFNDEKLIFVGLFKGEIEDEEKFENKKFLKPESSKENEYIFLSNNLSYRLKFKAQPSEELFNLIERIAENFDLLEPFSRILEALEYICQNQGSSK